MKLVKLGAKYSLKNSWWLLLLWLLPSIFVGLCCGPYQIVQFINIYGKTTINGFGDIFTILMPFTWQRVVFTVLGILLVAVFLSMAIGQAESHMRSGKLKFKELFSYINNDILVVLINLVVLELIYIGLTFILGSIIFLFHLVLCGLPSVPSVLCLVIAIVLCCANILLYLLLSATLYINIPNMITNGYSLKEGISSTTQLISKNGFKLVIAYLLPYVIIIPLVSLLHSTSIWWLANILCFLLTSVYYTALTMTSYFELSDTNRYDNRKYYNYK